MQSAVATVVAANSVPCLHPLLPTLRLGSNLSFYPTLQDASPMSTSQDCLPALCLRSHLPAASSCLVVGAYLAAQVSFWTGQQKRPLPGELWSSTAGHTTVGNLHYLHVFSVKAYCFLTCSWTHQLHLLSFFRLVRALWIVYAMHLKINIHSKFLLWSVASDLLQLGRMTVSAREKYQRFLIHRQKIWSMSDGNKSLKEPLKLYSSSFYSV